MLERIENKALINKPYLTIDVSPLGLVVDLLPLRFGRIRTDKFARLVTKSDKLRIAAHPAVRFFLICQ